MPGRNPGRLAAVGVKVTPVVVQLRKMQVAQLAVLRAILDELKFMNGRPGAT